MADGSKSKTTTQPQTGFTRTKKGEGPNVELRVILSSTNAGAVIGKKGGNIKRLRKEYVGTTILVPDSNSEERILSITGQLGSVTACMFDIVPLFDEYADFKSSGSTDFVCELHVLIHNMAVGRIIGRSGAMITEIREKTGTKFIKVIAEALPNSTDRVVYLKGKLASAVIAVDRILSIVNDVQVSSFMNIPFDPNKNPVSFFGQSFGKEEEANLGPLGGCKETLGGNRGGQLGSHPSTNKEEERASNKWQERPCSQVTIPKDVVGHVIGKGGERIKRIRQRSQADIKISDARPGSDECITTIYGTEKQIEAAQYYMQQAALEYLRGKDKMDADQMEPETIQEDYSNRPDWESEGVPGPYGDESYIQPSWQYAPDETYQGGYKTQPGLRSGRPNETYQRGYMTQPGLWLEGPNETYAEGYMMQPGLRSDGQSYAAGSYRDESFSKPRRQSKPDQHYMY